MGPALQDVPDRQMEQPSGITTVRINPENGLLARPQNPESVKEYFIEDQLPELEPPLGLAGGNNAPEQIF